MTPPNHIPFVVTYRKTGTKPPVFVAGSFTEPSWQPQQMEAIEDASGEYLFSKELQVTPGRTYEIKFKIGHDDWWVYDDDKPVVTDCDGNENNVLTIPLPHSSASKRRPSSGKVLNELGLMDHGCFAPPAASIVSGVDHCRTETADKRNATSLDGDTHNDSEPEYTCQKTDKLRTPLFSHECFGPYKFMADDRMETTDFQELENRRQSRKLSRDYAVDQVDINDPSIEKFPSEKSSVFDSLRKIQSSLPADSIPIDEPPTFSQLEFRRPSIDSSEDGATSTGSMSPTSPTSLRKRESRVSHSSFGKTKSAVSLTSIAEEPKDDTRAKPRMPASSHLKPDGSCSSASDGEDSIAMKSNKVKTPMPAATRSSSQGSMGEQIIDNNRVVNSSHEDTRCEGIACFLPHASVASHWLSIYSSQRQNAQQEGWSIPNEARSRPRPKRPNGDGSDVEVLGDTHRAFLGIEHAGLSTLGIMTLITAILWWKAASK